MNTPLAGMLLVLATGGALAACGNDRDSSAIDTQAAPSIAVADDTIAAPEAVARARQAANGLGRELMTKLIAALDSGGPSQAVGFCADSAQAWTARQAAEGVYIRRVSLRVRNPANSPDAREREYLEQLDSLHRAGTLPGELVTTGLDDSGERVVTYMRPIVVQERCLACHGARDRLAPGVPELLAARYPADAATGYETGDLRGMISVRVRQ